MRLIDADALKAALVPLWNCHDDSDFTNKDVWREVENAPTIDAVPVVRCKDCRHRHDIKECPRCYGILHADDDGITIFYDTTVDDGFCDKGERKEE